jgi:hypothetical protein
MMKRGALANPGARQRLAKAALSGIAADKAAGTVYDIINQSINQSAMLTSTHDSNIRNGLARTHILPSLLSRSSY